MFPVLTDIFHRIIKVRETRLTGMLSHILIGLSIFLIPYPMAYIPTAVLDGLFLYMAITSLNGNQMFERITLLFMEQVSDAPLFLITTCLKSITITFDRYDHFSCYCHYSQAAYPPNHYIRRCPQRKIHTFTMCQMVQLGLMCFFGFSPWPYVKMVFPVFILLLLPTR